jgi:predicted dehydrogenase
LGKSNGGQEIRFPQVDQFAEEMDDFADCIMNNKPRRVSWEESLRDLKIITAIYKSIRTGQAVKLP